MRLDKVIKQESGKSILVEKLRQLFPLMKNDLPLAEFSGDYENFLKTRKTAEASMYQLLGIAINNMEIPEKEIEELINELENNNIKIINRKKFISDYNKTCSINIPVYLRQYIETENLDKYLDINARFMFKKIKEYIS